MAAKSYKIHLFAFFAAVATGFQVRAGLWGRKVILSVDGEAAGAALTKGAGKNEVRAYARSYALGDSCAVRHPYLARKSSNRG